MGVEDNPEADDALIEGKLAAEERFQAGVVMVRPRVEALAAAGTTCEALQPLPMTATRLFL